MSLGHTVRGASLNIEMTPVGVGDELATVVVELLPSSDAVVVATGVRTNDGQHSGRSSEQPIKGTSINWPSAKWSAVYCGIVHLDSGERTHINYPWLQRPTCLSAETAPNKVW